MAKTTIRRRKTRSDILPERLFARQHIATKQATGRSRLVVTEIARAAMADVISQTPERLGPMATEAMKDVVRGELSRPMDSEAGTPEWVSTGGAGRFAREYVHVSVAKGETLGDTVEYRRRHVEAVQAKVDRLAEILAEVQATGCSVEAGDLHALAGHGEGGRGGVPRHARSGVRGARLLLADPEAVAPVECAGPPPLRPLSSERPERTCLTGERERRSVRSLFRS